MPDQQQCILDNNQMTPTFVTYLHQYMENNHYVTQSTFATIPPEVQQDFARYSNKTSDFVRMVHTEAPQIEELIADNYQRMWDQQEQLTADKEAVERRVEQVSNYRKNMPGLDGAKNYCACIESEDPAEGKHCYQNTDQKCSSDRDCMQPSAGIACYPDTCTSLKEMLFYNPSVDKQSQEQTQLQVDGKVQPANLIVFELNGECMIQVIDDRHGKLTVNGHNGCKNALVINSETHTASTIDLFHCDIRYDQVCTNKKCSVVGNSCQVDEQCQYPYTFLDSCSEPEERQAGILNYTPPPSFSSKCGPFFDT